MITSPISEALRSNPSHLNHVHPYRSSSRYSRSYGSRRSTYRQQNSNRYPRVEYAQNYNSSKGTYFKGGYDADGNYFDID